MDHLLQDGEIDVGAQDDAPTTNLSSRVFAKWLVGVSVAILVLACGALAGARGLSHFLGETLSSGNFHRVSRGGVAVVFVEEGPLESSANLEIKCRVRSGGSAGGGMSGGGGGGGGQPSGGGGRMGGGMTILSIVPDGSVVKRGDELVQLDTSRIEDQISAQTIVVEKARAAEVTAVRSFAAAKIAFDEYLNGAYRTALHAAETSVRIATENLRVSEAALAGAEKLARQGYANELQLKANRFALERAKLDLSAAETALNVLVTYTRQKTLEQLASVRDSLEAQMRASITSRELEESRMADMRQNLERCTLRAPQDGLVIYGNVVGGQAMGPGGGPPQAAIEEGATVRDQQTILQLPDLTKMQVVVTMHESLVLRVNLGMRARIRVAGRDFTGSVTKIATQPRAMPLFSGQLIFEYPVTVRIDNPDGKLRPGLTASVSLGVDEVRGVLNVPVTAVVEEDDGFHCWVRKRGGGYERRRVFPGISDYKVVEIKDGLLEGDIVLLKPLSVLSQRAGGT